MKKELLFASLFAALVACDSGGYKVSSTVDDTNLEGKTVYLVNYDTKDTIDSAIVKDKKLIISGKVEKPVIVRLVADGTRGGMLILEPGDIAFDFKSRMATGTELNDKFVELNKKEDELESKIQELPASDTATPEDIAKIQKSNQEIIAQINKAYSDTYNENKNNPLGYYAFLQYTYEFSAAQFDSIMADAPKSLGEMKRVQSWIEGAKKKVATGVGQKFTDFTVATEDGETVKLSDFVGKGDYMLVDFWASWCGPCIKETKTIKEIYNKYTGKGLEVLGVAVWDEPEKTLEAMKKHEMPWAQIINAKTIPTDIYGINGIPHIIIFAPDGTIVSRGLMGDELKAKVDELMSKK